MNNLIQCIRYNRKCCVKRIINNSLSSKSTIQSPTMAITPTIEASNSNDSVAPSFLTILQDASKSSEKTNKYKASPTLINSLQKYYSLYCHMHVPKHFIVPSTDPWPKELWAYKLGEEVNTLKHVHDFEFYKSNILTNRKKNSQLVISALRKYKEIYGNLEMKREFVVPSFDDRWPQEMIGFKLGNRYTSIVNLGHYKELHRELDGMGIIWHHIDKRNEKIILAMKTYKKIYGNLDLIKKKFVIPNDDNWPKSIHGLKFGSMINNLRSGIMRVDSIKSEANKLGFVWDLNVHKWKRIEMSLLVFQQVFFHFLSFLKLLYYQALQSHVCPSVVRCSLQRTLARRSLATQIRGYML